MSNWQKLNRETQLALIEWFNCAPDEKEKEKLAEMKRQGNFWYWDCWKCGSECLYGNPDNWEWCQGVIQEDYISYPGNLDMYTKKANFALCDNCRASSIKYIPDESYGND